MDNLAILRKNLRYLRRKNGYSQEFVATFCHKKSYTTVQKWETGDAEPSLKQCLALCRLYDINIETLLYVDLENKQ